MRHARTLASAGRCLVSTGIIFIRNGCLPSIGDLHHAPHRNFTEPERDVGMTRFALSVDLKAKPGQEEDVAAFLAGARPLVMAEPGILADKLPA